MPVLSLSVCCNVAIHSFPCREISRSSSSSGLNPFLIIPPSLITAGGESIIAVAIFSTIFSKGSSCSEIFLSVDTFN